ncbi:MAG: hypothetical protein KJO34_03870 [Deltaproteobacteria bacterium]|nr:hypothetical protein [Deltaproteobacteria bacterium]
MAAISLEKVFAYLGTRTISGSEKELRILCIRIGELVELNGGKWVKENRQKLLEEWEFIVNQGIIP